MSKKIGGGTATSELLRYQPLGPSCTLYEFHRLVVEEATSFVASSYPSLDKHDRVAHFRLAVEAYIVGVHNAMNDIRTVPVGDESFRAAVQDDLYGIWKTLRYSVGDGNEAH